MTVYKQLSTAILPSGPPFFDDSGRLLVDFNESIYTGGAHDFIVYWFTGTTSSVGTQNKRVIDGHLTIDANCGFYGASLNLVLPLGIVTDALATRAKHSMCPQELRSN